MQYPQRTPVVVDPLMKSPKEMLWMPNFHRLVQVRNKISVRVWWDRGQLVAVIRVDRSRNEGAREVTGLIGTQRNHHEVTVSGWGQLSAPLVCVCVCVQLRNGVRVPIRPLWEVGKDRGVTPYPESYFLLQRHTHAPPQAHQTVTHTKHIYRSTLRERQTIAATNRNTKILFCTSM